MTYAEAITIAIRLCKKHGEEEVAKVLYELPQARIARNAKRIHRKLSAVGMDLNEILKESKEANESQDTTRMAIASTKLEMALKVIDAKYVPLSKDEMAGSNVGK